MVVSILLNARSNPRTVLPLIERAPLEPDKAFAPLIMEVTTMTPFARAVTQLIEKIEVSESKECNYLKALAILQSIQNCLANPQSPGLDSACARLRDHWLHSVAWCSDLSRDIEKILILSEEMNLNKNR